MGWKSYINEWVVEWENYIKVNVFSLNGFSSEPCLITRR
jgi:hypothetical protein